MKAVFAHSFLFGPQLVITFNKLAAKTLSLFSAFSRFFFCVPEIS